MKLIIHMKSESAKVRTAQTVKSKNQITQKSTTKFRHYFNWSAKTNHSRIFAGEDKLEEVVQLRIRDVAHDQELDQRENRILHVTQLLSRQMSARRIAENKNGNISCRLWNISHQLAWSGIHLGPPPPPHRYPSNLEKCRTYVPHANFALFSGGGEVKLHNRDRIGLHRNQKKKIKLFAKTNNKKDPLIVESQWVKKIVNPKCQSKLRSILLDNARQELNMT